MSTCVIQCSAHFRRRGVYTKTYWPPTWWAWHQSLRVMRVPGVSTVVYSLAPVCFVFEGTRAPSHFLLSIVNFYSSILAHFKGTKAMTRGHGCNRPRASVKCQASSLTNNLAQGVLNLLRSSPQIVNTGPTITRLHCLRSFVFQQRVPGVSDKSYRYATLPMVARLSTYK